MLPPIDKFWVSLIVCQPDSESHPDSPCLRGHTASTPHQVRLRLVQETNLALESHYYIYEALSTGTSSVVRVSK